MDATKEEQSLFDHVACNIAASVDEFSIPWALALDLIEHVLGDDMILKSILSIYSCLSLIVFNFLSPRL